MRHFQPRSASGAVAVSLLSAGIALGLLVPPAVGQEPSESTESSGQETEALGTVRFEITCSELASAEFERAVALLHHMMYVDARAAFEGVARQDPNCAMAHWGIAMTLFQPLWPTRPSVADLARGVVEVEMARSAGLATGVERALVEAVAAFFDPEGDPSHFERLDRFAAVMAAAYELFPDHPEVAAFFALAHLATASRTDKRSTHQRQAAHILAAIYETEPTHPGALHYTIHANDVEGRADLALDMTRSYGDIAPSVPHALHMPTHIYVRLAAWAEVIDWNRRSADAALERPAGAYTSAHYPHAADYLMYAYLQRAEDDQAAALLAELRGVNDYQPTFPSAYALAAMPARYLLERREWGLAAALNPPPPRTFPWERFPHALAMTYFARGLGAARAGDREAAAEALAVLDELRERTVEAGETYWVRQIDIQRLSVQAWVALLDELESEALLLMASAVELETATQKDPVTPGTLQPSLELMGDLYMKLGRPQEALAAYERGLAMWPGRFNGLLGAARAAVQLQRPEVGEGYYRTLVGQLGPGATARPGAEEARRYLSGAAGSASAPARSSGRVRPRTAAGAPAPRDE